MNVGTNSSRQHPYAQSGIDILKVELYWSFPKTFIESIYILIKELINIMSL